MYPLFPGDLEPFSMSALTVYNCGRSQFIPVILALRKRAEAGREEVKASVLEPLSL